jgi:hypothetical protein
LNTTTTPEAVSPAAFAAALQAIADALKSQTEAQVGFAKLTPKPKKTMKQYLRERKTRGMGKETIRPSYQKGRPINAQGFDPETIERLDTLATGKYCNGDLEVVRVGRGDESRIHIFYDSFQDNRDMRWMFYMKYPTFKVMVDAIHADMAGQGIQPVVEARPKPAFEDEPDEE